MDITNKRSVTSTDCLFNVTIVDWCSKKYTGTSWSSFNSDTREMYKGVVDQNWIISFCPYIGYPIGAP